MKKFSLKSNFSPTGDQPNAIKILTDGINSGKRDQVLLGVTGSGKTFTIANVIQNTQKSAMIMVHNKTLASQIYLEMKSFFPENAVEYFVSDYDYYQPEAYLPKIGKYIQKDAALNDKIGYLRHSAVKSLIERKDVIVIATVSSLYGINPPDVYKKMRIEVKMNTIYSMQELLYDLVKLQYSREFVDFSRGVFRINGDTIDIFPSDSNKYAIKIEYFGNEIDSISKFDPITNTKIEKIENINIYSNSDFTVPIEIIKESAKEILNDLNREVEFFRSNKKFVEAERLEKKTKYDIEMLTETGSCQGIENYSGYFSERSRNSHPYTMFDYFSKDSILIMDESHISVPQIRVMHAGDASRKKNLIENGFRLSSAFDNRPLNFEEWNKIRPQTIYISATPSPYEIDKSNGISAEQIIRPTGLLDPICEIKSLETQIKDILSESKKCIKNKSKVLVITITKKQCEEINNFLISKGIKSVYLHSEIDTLERSKIIKDFRSDKYDVLVGVNLLREGIDIPECELVAIMNADKEGFLRSKTSLIQLIGRSARNEKGRVILYANKITNSIQFALDETNKRRKIQEEYNKKNNITPKSIKKEISDIDF